MPQYCYKCAECEHEFEEWHSIKEKLEDCPQCKKTKSLFRVPFFNITSRVLDNLPAKVGSIVNKHIEEAKEDIKKEKEELSKKEFK